MSVILIGLPSCGKSTLGVILAKRLGYKFIDSDLLIQEKTKKLLPSLIEELGTEGFIALENEVNLSITDECAVIATGGSAIYGEEAMRHLRTLGKIVYIKLSYKSMQRRLGDYTHRGVVIRSGATLYDMYKERCPLYEKYADITIEEQGGSISRTVSRLVEALGERE